MVNDWAGRSDLVAFVGERASVDMGAPALYNPASAEIEVNTGVAFGTCDAQYVGDLRQREVQYDFPKAVGAIYHEACHAKFTTWDLVKSAKELTESQNRALHLLEESRIERLGILTNPRNKLFLRTSAMEIVMADLKDEDIAKLSSTRQAGQVVGLTYARVDAGVLQPADVDPLRDKVEELLGDILPDLTAIWTEFHRLVPDYDEARMYELAIEWDKLIQDKAEENGEGSESAEGAGEGAGVAVSFSDELAEAGEAIEVEVYSALGDQQTREDYEETAKKHNDAAKDRKDNKQKSVEVFGKGTGPDESSATNSRLVESRPPTSEERVSAVKIGRALDKAKYRERDRVDSASELPPGRLRTRVLVQGQALKDKGVVSRTEPFQRVQRKHTDDPNLTVGVMVDISGSMGDAMNPMASTAWILSEATKRVQGKVAMVY
jgi:rubrerythrin